MAEATAMRNNALPYPVYGVAFTIAFPLLDADGDPISPSSPDSEVSKNGDTFADCANEATEIATSSGVCYLTLTAAEMTADIVTVRVQSTGAKTTVITLYPRKLPVLSTGTCQGSNDTGDIQLASGEPAVDDYYNGCLVVAVIDGTTEARVINDYVGSTKVGEVSPAWNTAQPDSNDTYTIYLPEGRQFALADTRAFGGTAGTFAAGRPEVNTTHLAGTSQTARDVGASVLLSSGTGTGQVTLTSGRVNADITHIATAAVSASAAQLGVNVVNFGGSAGTFSSGRPEVNASHWGGTAVGSTEVRANLINVAGSAVSASSGLLNANVTQISGDSTAADNLESYTDGTTPMPVNVTHTSGDAIERTLQAGGTTSITLASTEPTADDALNGYLLYTTGGTGASQTLEVTDYVGSTRVATVRLWQTEGTPATTDGTTTYQVLGPAPDYFLDTEIADIQARLPAALVGGRIDATVDATGMEAGAVANIVAGVGLTLASGTIGSTGNGTTALHLTGLTYGDDELNDYLIVVRDVSEGEYHARWIEDWANTGDLATVATLPFTPQNATDTYVILAVRQDVSGGSGLDAAGVRAAVGLASANLDTQLGDLPTNAELAASQAAADDATLAAIAALNNLSAAQVNAEVDTALADVGLTTTVTGRIDAAVSSRMATYAQPTGFLAATFPATVASTTNITAGTITTVTTLTNLPAVTTNWLTAAGIAADAGAEIAAAVLAAAAADPIAANVEEVNAVALVGDGDATPWGPA